jgi:hypothetical protein
MEEKEGKVLEFKRRLRHDEEIRIARENYISRKRELDEREKEGRDFAVVYLAPIFLLGLILVIFLVCAII